MDLIFVLCATGKIPWYKKSHSKIDVCIFANAVFLLKYGGSSINKRIGPFAQAVRTSVLQWHFGIWDLSIEKSILIFFNRKSFINKVPIFETSQETHYAKGNNKENKESKVYVIKQVTEHLVPPKSVGRTHNTGKQVWQGSGASSSCII